MFLQTFMWVYSSSISTPQKKKKSYEYISEILLICRLNYTFYKHLLQSAFTAKLFINGFFWLKGLHRFVQGSFVSQSGIIRGAHLMGTVDTLITDMASYIFGFYLFFASSIWHILLSDLSNWSWALQIFRNVSLRAGA